MAFDRVVMETEGLMLEKLINRAVKEKIRIQRAFRPDRRRLIIETDTLGARRFSDICARYHLPCRITGRYGISASIEKIKRRITVTAALAASITVCAIFLSRVWVVDIKLIHGSRLPQGIESVLAETGIIKGRNIADEDTAIAAARLKALRGCSHASVSRKGITVCIEIAAEEPSPEIYSIAGSSDLIAARDGIISSVNVKSGTATVRPGDTVRRGQVLIAGFERESKESVRDVSALGSVTARCWSEGHSEASAAAFKKHRTGRESTAKILVTPWKSFIIKKGETYGSCDSFTEKVPLAGMFIPIYIETVRSHEYVLMPAECDINSVKAAILAESEEKAHQNLPDNAEIIDKWTDFSMIESDDIIHARTVIEFETEIAVTRRHMEENHVD